jgi:hypothetical protein
VAKPVDPRHLIEAIALLGRERLTSRGYTLGV